MNLPVMTEKIAQRKAQRGDSVDSKKGKILCNEEWQEKKDHYKFRRLGEKRITI